MLKAVPVEMPRSESRPASLALPMLLRSMKEKSLGGRGFPRKYLSIVAFLPLACARWIELG